MRSGYARCIFGAPCQIEWYSGQSDQGRSGDEVGGSKVSIQYSKFPWIGRLLLEIHCGFLQDSGSFDPVDEEDCHVLLGAEHHPSFETLRQRLCEAPILTLPEGVEDFMVYCDASIMGLYAVLM